MAAPRVSNRPVQVGQNQHKNRFSDSSLLFSVCFGWYFEDPGPFLNCLQISVCVCVWCVNLCKYVYEVLPKLWLKDEIWVRPRPYWTPSPSSSSASLELCVCVWVCAWACVIIMCMCGCECLIALCSGCAHRARWCAPLAWLWTPAKREISGIWIWKKIQQRRVWARPNKTGSDQTRPKAQQVVSWSESITIKLCPS